MAKSGKQAKVSLVERRTWFSAAIFVIVGAIFAAGIWVTAAKPTLERRDATQVLADEQAADAAEFSRRLESVAKGRDEAAAQFEEMNNVSARLPVQSMNPGTALVYMVQQIQDAQLVKKNVTVDDKTGQVGEMEYVHMKITIEAPTVAQLNAFVDRLQSQDNLITVSNVTVSNPAPVTTPGAQVETETPKSLTADVFVWFQTPTDLAPANS